MLRFQVFLGKDAKVPEEIARDTCIRSVGQLVTKKLRKFIFFGPGQPLKFVLFYYYFFLFFRKFHDQILHFDGQGGWEIKDVPKNMVTYSI